MKVLMISRATLYSSPGGDTVQIDHTAKGLRQLGVEVDIVLTNQRIAYSQYDLIHFFNIIRPADILFHIQASEGKPYLVSTIFVDYEECEKILRKGLAGLLVRVLSGDTIEYLKSIARWVMNGERINSWKYLWMGHRRSVQYIIRHAAMLLPNSNSEYRRLVAKYNVQQVYTVIPNAVDVSTFVQNEQTGQTRQQEIVLCVGRIEARKNQLSLIRALNNTAVQLYIIGKASPNTQAYYQQCQAEAADNVHFIHHCSPQELAAWYAKAWVHVLPSWFETTGLSSLEAAAMGCQIVVTKKGDTEEYFEQHAYYCQPEDELSIKKAVLAAIQSTPGSLLQEKVRREYTWEQTATKTQESYCKVLRNQDICSPI